jgi:4-amino-4-deoxy-L-arabinose transferase-like glycosyltransferase
MQERSVNLTVLFLLPLLLYLAPLPFIPLMEPDEGRYSAIPDAMNATGDYVTPRLKGAVYFEKPPLSYWATAMAFRIFGRNEFASRLFPALCAWGCILLVYHMGRYFRDRRTGLFGAAVLTTMLYHIAIGRINILDMPLCLFVCLAIWSGFRHLATPAGRKAWLYGLYFFSALAFLAKGLIGIVFPFGVLVLWLLWSKRWRDLFALISPVGILVFSAVTLPWLILVQRENPDFFRFFFIQEHFLRYATKLHDRYQPFYFYLPILLAGTLPWCAYLPQALRSGGHGEQGFGSEGNRFLLVWFGLILLFFSLSSSKLIPYIAPVFLPLALWFGLLFRRSEEGYNSTAAMPLRYRLTGILQALLFMAALFVPLFLKEHQIGWTNWWPWIVAPLVLQALLLFLPDRLRGTGGWFASIYLLFAFYALSLTAPVAHFLEPYKSARALSQAIAQHVPRNELLYQYGMSLYGVDFYTGRRTPIVDDIGEVRYGSEQLPAEERNRYFLTSETFFRLIKDRQITYCATENDEKLDRLKKEMPASQVLWHNRKYVLLKLGGT